MNTFIKLSVVVFATLALAACGGGGGGGGTAAPAPVTVTADTVTMSGQAGWPGATTVTVTIDGTVVPLTNGTWTHVLDLQGATERTVRVAMIADGITVALRDVTVSR